MATPTTSTPVALVTGAGSGIGRAVALRLAGDHAVVAHDRNGDDLATTAELAREDGNEITTRVGDLSDPAECAGAVAACIDSHGRLDLLANIAGVALVAHLADTDDDMYRRVMAVNADAVFHLSRAALPHLLEHDGCIVNLASSAGITGIAYNSAYCMSKGAVVQLTRSMALEFTNTGLRVNAIAPGAVDTPMVQKLEVPDDIDFGVFLRSSAPGRPAATPQQVAELVAYLASEAASAINGAVLSMDGGASAG